MTHTALVTPAVLTRVESLNSPFARLVVDLMLFFRDAYLNVFGFSDPPLHDPCAIAWLIRPEIFRTRLMHVDIECTSTLCYGRTVCDTYGLSKESKNVEVCLSMDVEPFWSLMMESLHHANANSCMNSPTNEAEPYQPKHSTTPNGTVIIESTQTPFINSHKDSIL